MKTNSDVNLSSVRQLAYDAEKAIQLANDAKKVISAATASVEKFGLAFAGFTGVDLPLEKVPDILRLFTIPLTSTTSKVKSQKSIKRAPVKTFPDENDVLQYLQERKTLIRQDNATRHFKVVNKWPCSRSSKIFNILVGKKLAKRVRKNGATYWAV